MSCSFRCDALEPLKTWFKGRFDRTPAPTNNINNINIYTPSLLSADAGCYYIILVWAMLCAEKILSVQSIYSLYREYILCTENIFSVQWIYSLYREYIPVQVIYFLYRAYILCTENIFSVQRIYSLYREYILRTENILSVQRIYSPYREYNVCKENIFYKPI